MKKDVTDKPITDKKNDSTTFFDEYYNLLQKDKLQMTERGISLLAEDLFDWASTSEDAVILSNFYLRKGIDQRTFHNWLKRSPELRKSHIAAMELISNRREQKALDRTFDAGMVRYTMPHYSKAYKKLEEWRAGLKEKKDDSGGTKIVIMEKFASDKE